MVKVSQKHQKEIVALSTFEAVRLRPTMYVGQVAPMDDKLPIIRDGKLQQVDKQWSPGFMHMIVEILENAIDEAKRQKGKMKNIFIDIYLDTNRVTVIDQGGGFHRANMKHSKTKKNIVRTAMEDLHAGSNFADSSTNILGTHGVGSAVVNILSEEFEIVTMNKTHCVNFKWKDYKVVEEDRHKKEEGETIGNSTTGTSITFIPSKEVFKNHKWDRELIETYLSFKQFLIDRDKSLKNLKISGTFIYEGGPDPRFKDPNVKETIREPIKISTDFLPEKTIVVDNKEWGTIMMWPSYEDSTSVSFVNGSQCTGIHQKIINDWGNEFFDYNLAHHFYDTLVSLNVPSTLMRFADQNKTKYALARFEIEEILENNFRNKLIRLLKGSDIAKEIEQRVEDKLFAENIKKIKKAQRTSKRKISDKYSPASRYKESIYITEGLSAAGSVRQARDSEREGVYALKGKVKNTKRLSDLTNNGEILEIMSILGLIPDEQKTPQYKNIIIATDEDPDGQHIASLIINFFHKWFPYIIEEGRLMKLVTPLVAGDYKNSRKYFLSMEEFNKFTLNRKLSNVNYLKGLGSLSISDWEYVMGNKTLFQIVKDRSSNRFLDIAFGDSAAKRKKWLEGSE